MVNKSKPEKGKPLERVGRKATGLSSDEYGSRAAGRIPHLQWAVSRLRIGGAGILRSFLSPTCFKKHLHILTVDDDSEIRAILHEALIYMGHASTTAVDGVDALEKLANHHFDIVVTDLNMPHMDGTELIKRIKADFDGVDVIAITGDQSKYKYTEVIDLGASDFISKPFELNELEARINRVIRERSLLAEFERLSTRDGLSGLYNRRYFDESSRREAARALRQRYSLHLLLIDIDNFKLYNDTYGHQQGDSLIIEIAKTIICIIRRDVDSGYRYGGDEFAVILPHATPKQALMIAERIRNGFKDKNVWSASLSIGMAKLTGCRKTLEEDLRVLIREADRALYRAKKNGGNQICEERDRDALLVTFDTDYQGWMAFQRKSPSLKQLFDQR